MKFDSPFFDRIRVKPGEDRRRNATAPRCDWPDCSRAASHRAPKGRSREKEYWNFCIDHVREYNQSYNYFAGMDDDAVARYQKDALTGHRPTWRMGMSGGGSAKRGRSFQSSDAAFDPFDVFREFGGAARPTGDSAHHQAQSETRAIRNAERKALHTLGLEAGADRTEIKATFKLLVKRHHPDANGGDRGSEEKLREIIEAYNFLKSAGCV